MDSPKRPKTAVFLQDACYQHRFIRSNDLSAIVERPERLRALKIGLAAAISRLEEVMSAKRSPLMSNAEGSKTDAGDDLAAALQKLDLLQDVENDVVNIIRSSAFVDLLHNEAVKFVHGDIEGDVYLENIIKWATESSDKIKNGESEIPAHFNQGDLYLCPESLAAIQGALGTVCEAVDAVMADLSAGKAKEENGPPAPTKNAFVAIRPPGHHCGEDTPSGFCFVNNVVVGAAHAHLKHGVKKVVIFDIDLHHGNGTQSLIWQINEETYRLKLEAESGENPDPQKPGLQCFYGSIHDILSYPCEDGKISLVQAASASIHGPHGQHIENIHLLPYESDQDFWENLYPNHYAKILLKAQEFVIGSDANEVLVFISCGFDACEHEYASMSRHGRRVPASFYHRFAVEARTFAEQFANGKLISVLEGGYSDRALTSGGFAHLSGLVDTEYAEVDESWWKIENLIKLEKATKKRRGGKASLPGPGEKWIERTVSIFQSIETNITPSPSRSNAPLPPSSRVLRERKPANAAATAPESPQTHRVKGKSPQSDSIQFSSAPSIEDIAKDLESLKLVKQAEPDAASPQSESASVKKLPRVILRVKGPEESAGS